MFQNESKEGGEGKGRKGKERGGKVGASSISSSFTIQRIQYVKIKPKWGEKKKKKGEKKKGEGEASIKKQDSYYSNNLIKVIYISFLSMKK